MLIEPHMVMQAFSPATGREAETGRFQVQVLPGLQSEFKASLDELVRHYLKIKTKKGLGVWLSGSMLA